MDVVTIATLLKSGLEIVLEQVRRQSGNDPLEDLRPSLLELHQLLQDWAELAEASASQLERGSIAGLPLDRLNSRLGVQEAVLKWLDDARYSVVNNGKLLEIYAPSLYRQIRHLAFERALVVRDVLQIGEFGDLDQVNVDEVEATARGLREAEESLRDFIASNFPLK